MRSKQGLGEFAIFSIRNKYSRLSIWLLHCYGYNNTCYISCGLGYIYYYYLYWSRTSKSRLCWMACTPDATDLSDQSRSQKILCMLQVHLHGTGASVQRLLTAHWYDAPSHGSWKQSDRFIGIDTTDIIGRTAWRIQAHVLDVYENIILYMKL